MTGNEFLDGIILGWLLAMASCWFTASIIKRTVEDVVEERDEL